VHWDAEVKEVLGSSGNPRMASTRTWNGMPGAWTATPNNPEPGGVLAVDTATGKWVPMAGISRAVFQLEPAPGNTVLAAAGDGIYRYTLAGGWKRISPQRPFRDVAFDPARPSVIFGATSQGILRTTDGGTHWHDLSDGLTVPSINALAFDASDGTLYAGTDGGSVLRLRRDPNPRPLVAVAPASINFGMVPVAFGKRLGITITNAGEADLVISSLTSTDPAFAVDAPFSLPLTITPGSWTDLALRFTPTLASPVAANIVVGANAANAPFSIPVQGQGYATKGGISVTVDPPTASWRVTTPWGTSYTRIGNYITGGVPTGSYVIEWQPVAGYDLPTNQPATLVVTTSGTATLAGTYRRTTAAAAQASTGGTKSPGDEPATQR